MKSIKNRFIIVFEISPQNKIIVLTLNVPDQMKDF